MHSNIIAESPIINRNFKTVFRLKIGLPRLRQNKYYRLTIKKEQKMEKLIQSKFEAIFMKNFIYIIAQGNDISH